MDQSKKFVPHVFLQVLSRANTDGAFAKCKAIYETHKATCSVEEQAQIERAIKGHETYLENLKAAGGEQA